MGCILEKLFDPSPPDPSIKNFYHTKGLIIDVIDSSAAGMAADMPRKKTSTRTSSSGTLEVGPASVPFINKSTSNSSSCRSNSNSGILAKGGAIQFRPAGVLYVYNGSLVYRSRQCPALFRKRMKPLQIELRNIKDINCYNNFTSHKDCKMYGGQVVDVVASLPGNSTGSAFTPSPASTSTSLHIGFFTKQAEEVSLQLSETLLKHRQKPKIFQFNSVDVDGVEIDLP